MTQVKQLSFRQVVKLWSIRQAQKAIKVMEQRLTKEVASCFADDKKTERVNVEGMEVLKFYEGVDDNGQVKKVLNRDAAMELITNKRIKNIATTRQLIIGVNEAGLADAVKLGKITLEELNSVYNDAKVTMKIKIADKREQLATQDGVEKASVTA